jgi:hypothetical protein
MKPQLWGAQLTSEALLKDRRSSLFAGFLSFTVVGVTVHMLGQGHPNTIAFVGDGMTIVFASVTGLLCCARAYKADVALVTRETVEDRLDEMERLRRRNLISPEEYAYKRQEILKEL